MKSKHILFLIIVCLTLSVQSQTFFGFKVGGNAANLNGDVNENAIKYGFHFGAVAEIQLSDYFSIQPELLYSQQGFQDKNIENLKYNYNYMLAPVLLKYFVATSFSIDAGAQAAFLMSAKQGTGDEDLTDLKEFTNGFDMSFVIGGSYEMDNGFFANVRYNYGFINVFNNDDGSDLKATNAVIQLSMGYKFY